MTSSSEERCGKLGLCLGYRFPGTASSISLACTGVHWVSGMTPQGTGLPFLADPAPSSLTLKSPLRSAAHSALQARLWSKDKWNHCLFELHLLTSPQPNTGCHFSPCISEPTLDLDPAKVFSELPQQSSVYCLANASLGASKLSVSLSVTNAWHRITFQSVFGHTANTFKEAWGRCEG